MIKLCRNAHGDGQIVVAHPGNIHAGNGDDRLEILESLTVSSRRMTGISSLRLGEEVRVASAIEVVGNADGDASLA